MALVDDDLSPSLLLLQEYKRLKDEQLARIRTRDNLIYVTLASLAAVVVAILQARASELLLIAPPVCVVLGWTYLVNDEKVSAIGRHIRVVLVPQLESMTHGSVQVFTWEVAHRADRRRRWRKSLQLAVDVLTFCVPGLVALIVFWSNAQPRPVPFATSTLEFVMILILAYEMVANSDRARETPAAQMTGSRPAVPIIGREMDHAPV